MTACMKRALVLAVGLMLVTSIAFAGADKGKKAPFGFKGWATGDSYQELFNPETVVTLTGNAMAIANVAPKKDEMDIGIQMMLKVSEKKVYPVHLGPRIWVKKHGAYLHYGDDVIVTGSKIMFKNTEIVIATQVKKGDQILILRDEAGAPVWAKEAEPVGPPTKK